MAEERNKSVNQGTEAKQTLQGQALRAMATYPLGRSLMTYAELLCWDLHVTRRTAFESYILPMMRHGYLKYVGESEYDGKPIYNFANSQEPQKPQEPQIDYTRESEQKEHLTKLIEIELKTNPKLSESDAVQKFATKEINEDLIAFCFDIAKNHILIESQKNESATDYMKRRNKEKQETNKT
jgi:hypothetical protein